MTRIEAPDEKKERLLRRQIEGATAMKEYLADGAPFSCAYRPAENRDAGETERPEVKEHGTVGRL
jgi:hypothetical protein